ncbi:conserved oligomeric Golgi complex subunit 4 isoform 2-T2 [Glossina fuscipes fuscipes]
MDVKALIGDVDISTSAKVDEVLELIKGKEECINIELEALLAKQDHVEAKMNGIHKALSVLQEVLKDSNKLDWQIVHTAQLAESVSAKVRRLDLARSRVSECQQRVHDLIDLQLCSQGVEKAIQDEDYEIGAGHISRFLCMDLQLLKRTADDVQGSVSSVSEAVQTLEAATVEMRDLVVRRFDEAVKKDDLASVERFFKIFPLLGRHEEGIEKFSYYICTKLSAKAKKELNNALDIAKAEKRLPVAYADALTSLLENFARVIEVNQPIVEACYGLGHMLHMLTVLQRQCDLDIKNLILEFNKNRKISLRVQQVNESIRNSQTNSANSPSLGHYRKASGGSIDKLNPKDLDAIIAEITLMHSRAELYFRFMKRRVTADIEACSLDENEQQDQMDKLSKLLGQCDLSRQMQELLAIYLLLEKYFMEGSVIKAIALDAYENGQQCSSMVDDVFFVVRKSIRRALSSQSINGTCAVINNAASCLESDFVNALRSPLKVGYPSGYIDLAQAYNAIQTTLQQDMSTEYIETLWLTMEQEIVGTFPAMSAVERQIIDSCVAELKSVRDTLKACVDFGMHQLRSSAIKPRLHPWVDQYLNYKHHLSEEELAAYEAGETFVQYLIVQIDGFLSSFKLILTVRNYDALVIILATELTSRLERAIKKCTFNRLGGLVLEQEIRVLGAYLANATSWSWSVRDKMTRLTQIATILNLEKVSELNEYWDPENSSESPSWRITPNEVRTILTLRTDFRMEEIKRLRF